MPQGWLVAGEGIAHLSLALDVLGSAGSGSYFDGSKGYFSRLKDDGIK